eukprot:scaffold8567_cov83-Skeletonema_marinoi.AAC.4
MKQAMNWCTLVHGHGCTAPQRQVVTGEVGLDSKARPPKGDPAKKGGQNQLTTVYLYTGVLQQKWKVERNQDDCKR